MTSEPLPPLETIDSAPNAAFASIIPIHRSEGQTFKSVSQIAEFVEVPLLGTVTKLWDKNIPTLSSSANGETPEAYIDIDYDALSDRNRIVVQELMEADKELPEEQQRARMIVLKGSGNSDPHTRVKLALPLEGETPESVGAFFTDLADRFTEQDLAWAGQEQPVDQNLADFGYVQANDGKWYASADLADKQNAWLAAQPGDKAE